MGPGAPDAAICTYLMAAAPPPFAARLQPRAGRDPVESNLQGGGSSLSNEPKRWHAVFWGPHLAAPSSRAPADQARDPAACLIDSNDGVYFL